MATASTPATDDPRLGTLEVPVGDPTERIRVLGFARDEGCVINGGRAGASGGPDAVLKFLPRMGCVVNREFGVDLSDVHFSVGDVVCKRGTPSLDDAHTALEANVVAALTARARDAASGSTTAGGDAGGPDAAAVAAAACVVPSVIPFVVGGGNDQSFPNASALLRSLPPDTRHNVTVINIDAHFDVRPLKGGKRHSGSPFRCMMESAEWRAHDGHLIEFACQGSQCSAEHAEFITSHGGTIVWLSEAVSAATIAAGAVRSAALRYALRSPAACAFLRAMVATPGGRDGVSFVSFDIDSISGADCPGVSCPATVGLTAADAVAIAYLAGRLPAVRLMDVSELNPAVEDYRSPRLVVNMFYAFLMGVKERDDDTYGADAGFLLGCGAP